MATLSVASSQTARGAGPSARSGMRTVPIQAMGRIRYVYGGMRAPRALGVWRSRRMRLSGYLQRVGSATCGRDCLAAGRADIWCCMRADFIQREDACDRASLEQGRVVVPASLPGALPARPGGAPRKGGGRLGGESRELAPILHGLPIGTWPGSRDPTGTRRAWITFVVSPKKKTLLEWILRPSRVLAIVPEPG